MRKQSYWHFLVLSVFGVLTFWTEIPRLLKPLGPPAMALLRETAIALIDVTVVTLIPFTVLITPWFIAAELWGEQFREKRNWRWYRRERAMEEELWP